MVNGRAAVIFSADDLTFGLLGAQCPTCIGYYPDTAVQLMRNIVLYGAGDAATRPTTTTSQATSVPAAVTTLK
jgi:hypothetical protein